MEVILQTLKFLVTLVPLMVTVFEEVIVASNDLIYGLTEAGGQFGGGTLFKIDPTNNSFTKVHDFNPVSEGIFSVCSLIEYNGFLYGTLSQGGPTGRGSVFKLKLKMNEEFTLVHGFNGNWKIS